MAKVGASVSQTDRYHAAQRVLAAVGQAHVLTFFDRIDQAGRDRFLSQIEAIDWPEVASLIKTHVQKRPRFVMPQRPKPAPWYPHRPEDPSRYAQARSIGNDLICQGKVAAFTVAGGQSTRLGWDGPKGTFPATPVRALSLFGCFAEYICNVQERFGCVIPWYVMTSPVNDADTREFFEQQDYFGLDAKHVKLFPQAMMPAIDLATGRALLETPDSLALSPNGHGGSLKAMHTSGALADMRRLGIEQISFIQVDNPIVRVIDPLFLGLHALDGAQMSSKMLRKREPLEKLGNFCLIDGKMTVIEYSDLPDAMAHETGPDGSLRFGAGSIAIHAICVDFVESLNTAASGFALPFHRAEKKVDHIDLETGVSVIPTTSNAVKLEAFVFDALPLCDRSIVYETDRADEFAPIKNAAGEGVLDSPDTSKSIQVERARRWLRKKGVEVAEDATVEISQRTAIYPEDLDGIYLPQRIGAGESVVL